MRYEYPIAENHLKQPELALERIEAALEDEAVRQHDQIFT
jgi:hypothetical protein